MKEELENSKGPQTDSWKSGALFMVMSTSTALLQITGKWSIVVILHV